MYKSYVVRVAYSMYSNAFATRNKVLSACIMFLVESYTPENRYFNKSFIQNEKSTL